MAVVLALVLLLCRLVTLAGQDALEVKKRITPPLQGVHVYLWRRYFAEFPARMAHCLTLEKRRC